VVPQTSKHSGFAVIFFANTLLPPAALTSRTAPASVLTWHIIFDSQQCSVTSLIVNSDIFIRQDSIGSSYLWRERNTSYTSNCPAIFAGSARWAIT